LVDIRKFVHGAGSQIAVLGLFGSAFFQSLRVVQGIIVLQFLGFLICKNFVILCKKREKKKKKKVVSVNRKKVSVVLFFSYIRVGEWFVWFIVFSVSEETLVHV
jgi:hypothetical protein